MMVVQATGCARLRDANEGCEGTVVMGNGIDYAAEAELFDYATEAELFSVHVGFSHRGGHSMDEHKIRRKEEGVE